MSKLPNLKLGNSEGETKGYDTIKMSIIKELNAANFCMDHRLRLRKLKLITKQH